MIRKIICYTVLLSDSGCKNKMLCYVMYTGAQTVQMLSRKNGFSWLKLCTNFTLKHRCRSKL